MPRFRFVSSAFLTALLALDAPAAEAAPRLPEPKQVFFSTQVPKDAVTRLVQRIDAGEVALFGAERAVLRAVLRELEVPYQSQIVVFSRTSLQADIIRPANPRALYFSDSVYVGWVPGGLIEITAIDPELGPIFYAFNPLEATTGGRAFVREVSCVGCHGGSVTEGTPGRLFAHSLFTSIAGQPLQRNTGVTLTEETPFEQRWGGWYVTGYTGTLAHRGNAFSRERDGQVEFTPNEVRPVELSRYFDTARYPAGTSDVVALLIFEHQLGVHDSFARGTHRVRRLLEQAPGTPPDLLKGLLTDAADEVLDRLLFRGAAPLPGGVEGNTSFRQAFARKAPRDAQGRSLKDLSLQGRVFAHRCSFLIYSEGFTGLPVPLKELVLDRLHAALRDSDPQSRYGYIGAEEKQQILAILLETHPDFRARFGGTQ